jgi:hypothetical protein
MTAPEAPLPDDMSERQRMIVSLNQANNKIIAKCARYGVSVDGIGEERHEMLFNFLVDKGFIPPEYIEEFNLMWVDHLNQKLIKVEEKLDAKIAEAEREARRRALSVPPSTALLLPDGRRARGSRG